MELWWSELATAHKVFYAIALATSAILLLQLLLALFGLGGDGDFDADAHDAAVGVLSVRTVTAFFTGFGWGGVAALARGSGLLGAIAVALLAGGILMAAVFFLMRGLYALRSSGTLDYANAIGQTATVYLPVPAAMAGAGQIEVLVQGRLCVVAAMTRGGERLANQTRVRVVELFDPRTLIVEPAGARSGIPAES